MAEVELPVEAAIPGSRGEPERKGTVETGPDGEGLHSEEEDTPTDRKDKGKAVDIAPLLDDEALALEPTSEDEEEGEGEGDGIEVDWTKFEPPEELTKLPKGTSEVIVEVVNSAVENIKNQISQEETARQEREAEEAERRKAAEEAAATATVETAGTVAEQQKQQPSVPIIEVQEPEPESKSPRPQKRSRHFARFLRHIHVSERGETSAAGAARWYRNYTAASSADNTTLPIPLATSKAAGLLAKLKEKEKERQQQEQDPTPTETEECVSCFDDVPVKDAIKTVCHSYCRDCFERLITTAVENEAQWPPKCCLNEIPSRMVTKHASREVARAYADKAAEFKVPIEERLYCPTPNCGVFVPRSLRVLSTRVARCSRGHQTCTICRQAAHGKAACPEDRELQLTERLAAEEGWRHCIRCGVLVEHREACQHMTCRCGAEFCYVCGAVWRTCGCNMDALQRVKEAAARRREARDAEAAEEERELRELREALRLVEEFEREEARKAELLRLEQERLTIERRRREREERARREEARRAALDDKYAAERAALARVDRWQHAELRSAHRAAESELVRRATASRADLVRRQAADREALHATTLLRIREAEAEWDHDYRARVKLERALEDAYAAQLAVLWHKRPAADREARAAAALRAYMKRNDQRSDEYGRWRARKLEAARFHAEDEQAVREELMERAVQRADEFAAAERAGQRQRHAAERRWFRLVARERARLLAEMEDVERECGGESDPDPDADDDLLDQQERELLEAIYNALGSSSGGGSGSSDGSGGGGGGGGGSGGGDGVVEDAATAEALLRSLMGGNNSSSSSVNSSIFHDAEDEWPLRSVPGTFVH